MDEPERKIVGYLFGRPIYESEELTKQCESMGEVYLCRMPEPDRVPVKFPLTDKDGGGL